MNKNRKKKPKKKQSGTRPWARPTEWIVGRLDAPFYVTEGTPFRPEMILCLEKPNDLIVTHKVIVPKGPPLSIAEVLEEAFNTPMVGPPRKPKSIRVNDVDIAEELRGKFPDIQIVVAPTPELSDVLEAFAEADPAEQGTESYLEHGRISQARMAKLFKAASFFYSAKPWRHANDTQVLRVDIPRLQVHGGCVSILGAGDESFGLILFPSFEGFERFLSQARTRSLTGRKSDLGTSILSLNFERGADLPAALRKEVAHYGWEVAAPDAYPYILSVDKDNLQRPFTEREVHILDLCAISCATFVMKYSSLFEAPEHPPVLETYSNEDDVEVTVAGPYNLGNDSDDDFSDPPEFMEAAPFEQAEKVGRNDSCPCGSGKKYKKCCKNQDDAARAETAVPQTLHALDHQLVDRMMGFAVRRFKDAFIVVEMDFINVDDAMQLFAPWSVYHFLIEGRPVVEWFIEDKKQRLTDKETAWLGAQQTAWLSLWEVQSVSPGKGLTLKDLLTGEERTVTETKGSYNIRPRHVLCARIVEFEGISLIAGSHPRLLSPMQAAEVLERIKTRLRRKRYVPIERLRDEKLGRFMIEQWENKVEDADIAASVMPALQNMDGDVLLLTVDHFQLPNKNPDEITAKLAVLEDAELDERDRSIVFAREPTSGRGFETVTVGRARIENGKLSVETNSIERADALRDRLESLLGDDLRHITRTHVDPERAMDDLPESDQPTSLSSEEADAAVLAYKERFYGTWPESPIPMLDGKTPKQAVRTKRGREQVDLLLRDFENTEARLPTAQRYDFSTLRRTLKLDE